MWKVMQNEVLLRERSIVVTSHDLEEVEQYCNTVGILHHGRLVEMGPLVDIKKRWQDSIKLVCLFTKLESVSEVGDQLSDDLEDDIVIQSPHIDVLVDVPEETLIVATFAMDLHDIKNIAQLIRTMKNASDEMTTLRYWSVEPQTLDDFVKAKSNIDVI